MSFEKLGLRRGHFEAPEGRVLSRCRIASLWLLLAFLGLLAACGEAAKKSDGASSGQAAARQEMSPEEEARREQIASARYEQTRRLSPVEKVTALSDLAQVYHDTEVAPLAFMDLVFYLSDHSVDKPEEAFLALEDFERRRPMAPQLLAAANVMFSVATTKMKSAEGEEELAKMTRLRDRSIEIYAACATRLVGHESVENDAGSYYEIGNALVLAGRYAEAEKAWARVENFDGSVEDTRRLDLLIRRADLMRHNLERRKDALDLFLKARQMQDDLGRAISKEQIEYVESAIEELRG